MKGLKAVLFVCVVFFGCGSVSFSNYTTVVQSEGGVELHGCGNYTHSWILNSNDFPVRVRRVANTENGENTRSVDSVGAGERLELEGISLYDAGFYIYTMDGVMVEYVDGRCPGYRWED